MTTYTKNPDGTITKTDVLDDAETDLVYSNLKLQISDYTEQAARAQKDAIDFTAKAAEKQSELDELLKAVPEKSGSAMEVQQ